MPTFIDELPPTLTPPKLEAKSIDVDIYRESGEKKNTHIQDTTNDKHKEEVQGRK
jgi:hypothetical protein